MAKNISLLGADYPDVPAVQLPQTGGGTATFYDINVIDDLNSTSSTDALSARQGKVLKDDIDTLNRKVSHTALCSVDSDGVKDYATLLNALTSGTGIFNANYSRFEIELADGSELIYQISRWSDGVSAMGPAYAEYTRVSARVTTEAYIDSMRISENLSDCKYIRYNLLDGTITDRSSQVPTANWHFRIVKD